MVAFLGVSLVITKGDINVLSSTSGNLIPALLILTGVFAWVIYTIGGSNFTWSPLRYTTLSCILGTASALVIVVLATIAGYLKGPAVDTLATIRWEMGYLIVTPACSPCSAGTPATARSRRSTASCSSIWCR